MVLSTRTALSLKPSTRWQSGWTSSSASVVPGTSESSQAARPSPRSAAQIGGKPSMGRASSPLPATTSSASGTVCRLNPTSANSLPTSETIPAWISSDRCAAPVFDKKSGAAAPLHRRVALRARRALDRQLVGNRGARRVEQRIEPAGEADSGREEAPLDERTMLVGIEVTELLVADLVDSCPDRHRLLDPVEDARALPGPELGLGRMIDDLGELRKRELLRLDDLLVPDRVQVGALAEPGHLDVVAAAIVTPPDVERLVHVAHEMNEEAKRLDLLARLRPGAL